MSGWPLLSESARIPRRHSGIFDKFRWTLGTTWPRVWTVDTTRFEVKDQQVPLVQDRDQVLGPRCVCRRHSNWPHKDDCGTEVGDATDIEGTKGLPGILLILSPVRKGLREDCSPATRSSVVCHHQLKGGHKIRLAVGRSSTTRFWPSKICVDYTPSTGFRRIWSAFHPWNWCL